MSNIIADINGIFNSQKEIYSNIERECREHTLNLAYKVWINESLLKFGLTQVEEIDKDFEVAKLINNYYITYHKYRLREE